MQITTPPAEITDKLLMLGTGAYPLYLYRGEAGATLFEGGVGAMGPLLLEQLAARGIEPASVKRAVVTHAHPDHVMAVPLFREAFPGVEVLASAVAARTLSVEKAVGFFCKIDGALTASLLAAGLITEDHRPGALDEKTIAVDRVLREGDAIDVDAGTQFAVLETPGHSDGSLSFHEPGAGILVISDATGYYLPEHDFFWPNYFTGYDAYLASIRRLAGIEAEILCLSHNAVITGREDVATYLRKALQSTEAYHAGIVDAVRGGASPRDVAGRLGAEVHDKTQLLPLDFFQKNCGLLVKQSLQHEGIESEG
jgi:glyoxylase-like metal-dependent hydrolase (beta-lactamase superfamily II)